MVVSTAEPYPVESAGRIAILGARRDERAGRGRVISFITRHNHSLLGFIPGLGR
ncbi:hypothetical protein GCM10011612_16080 [Actinomyces gaoshouyii]|uniref:Uncharacterized protein n=1 Tax=Actinomyces gaoshouyii TaxID=1960083 RepID=A0A8H9HAY1_9ACTO|nr:hypothetical protein GCM10011612_16080 [Actinomyces gaoshouyii]